MLRREFWLTPGVMCSSLAGGLTLNGYVAHSVAGMMLPSGRMNLLVDFLPVCRQGSCVVPMLEVAALSATVVGIRPVAIPCWSSRSSTPMIYCRVSVLVSVSRCLEGGDKQ